MAFARSTVSQVPAPVRADAGFTLLEVLVAIAILGLGLTAILSAQTGLFASSSYAERVSLATGMARCRMSEIELKLAKEGYPLLDMNDEGRCCGDDETPGYKCKWKIQKVELPAPPTGTDLSGNMTGGGMSPSGFGSLGAIAAVGQSGGAALGQTPGLGDISKLLAGQTPISPMGGGMGASPFGAPPAGTDTSSSAFGAAPAGSATPPSPLGAGGPLGGMAGGAMGGGASSLAPLVMSLVYPTLKPMLEASIRKIVITVEWQQGATSRNLEVTQFVTNPMQGGIDPNAAQGLEAAFTNLSGLAGAALGGTPGGAAAGAKK